MGIVGRRPAILAAALTLALALVPLTDATAAPSFDEAARFLEQSTFGPTYDLITHVQQVGFDAFINEQFALTVPAFPVLDNWPQTIPSSCTGTTSIRSSRPPRLRTTASPRPCSTE